MGQNLEYKMYSAVIIVILKLVCFELKTFFAGDTFTSFYQYDKFTATIVIKKLRHSWEISSGFVVNYK